MVSVISFMGYINFKGKYLLVLFHEEEWGDL